MRPLSLFRLASTFLLASSLLTAQEDNAPVATLHLADGTTVALIDWKLTYEFVSWKSKEPISSAKPTTREFGGLLLGKKTYPLRGETLALTHIEGGEVIRVGTMSLKKEGALKIEQPARDVLAPELDKNYIYQPRSLDINGKTLSGIQRSFCVTSFSAMVECGGTKTTRVVKIDFN